jgi:alginate O-acetyltransferase complex protein AlgJ
MKPMALPLETPIAPPVRGGPTDPSHDAELRRGIIHTAVSRRVALGLVAAFLLVIYGVPISQGVMEKLDGEPSMLLRVFKRAPTRQNLKNYESDLEKLSYGKEFVQPRVQLALTRLGAGNKRSVIGRDGWLYFAPGVMSVIGPGFLDGAWQRVRMKEALDAQEAALYPDPRPAVLALHQALLRRGIRLVLFPVPDKAALQPAQLHRRGGEEVAANADHRAFVAELRAAGVLVFDPTPDRLRPGEPHRFLQQDTHWAPGWMEAVARDLAALVRANVALPAVKAPAWKVVPLDSERVGDVVTMLKLPDEQTLFVPQKVQIHQVQEADGNEWAPKTSADVLLLGDSFTNVFTLDSMGWGSAAGLAPQLAMALGRDLDVIAQNDSGAYATRQTLSWALRTGDDRLAGKKVVIWEFASRELAVGNWKPLDYEVKR